MARERGALGRARPLATGQEAPSHGSSDPPPPPAASWPDGYKSVAPVLTHGEPRAPASLAAAAMGWSCSFLLLLLLLLLGPPVAFSLLRYRYDCGDYGMQLLAYPSRGRTVRFKVMGEWGAGGCEPPPALLGVTCGGSPWGYPKTVVLVP